MGKFDGKQITGLVGGLVFRKGEDKTTIVQTRAVKVRQTKATKEAGSLFGKSSKLAKAIRTNLFSIVLDGYDKKMVNRLTKLTRELLTHCYKKDTKTFTFRPDSFDRLQGFEFNLKSPTTAKLWVKPEVKLIGNQLQVHLPEMQIPDQFQFPLGTNACEIRIAVAMMVLDQSLEHEGLFQSMEVNSDQTFIAAQQFNFEVPDGCFCVAGLNLYYYTRTQEGIRSSSGEKSFHPSAICGAIITPGTFVRPPAVRTANGGRASEWHDILGLSLATTGV